MAGLHVEEVIEESLVTGHALRFGTLRCTVHEPKCRQDSIGCGSSRYVPALDTDGIRGERKSNCCHTRETLCRPSIGCEPVGGIRFFPEPVEGPLLESIEKRSLPGSDLRRRCRRGSRGRSSRATKRENE